MTTTTTVEELLLEMTVETRTNPQQRSKERIFTLPETRVQYGEEHRNALSVYVGHSANNKRFIVNFSRIVVSPSSYSTIIDFGKDHPVKNYSVPVARYSGKALEQAFIDAVKVAEENLPALIEWANGAMDEHGIAA